jgi:predicted nucleic acid-binding protein
VSRFVVDASVVLTWCFPDEHSALAQRVAQMFQRGDSAIAPSFWPHEVLNALLVGEKRKRISRDLIRTFLGDLATLPIVLEGLQANLVFDRIQFLSREYAKANGLPLATLDQDLINACGKVSVEIF